MPGGSTEEACKNPWAMKYGLPNWMKANVNRLNTSTDFEQYASSPPETDSGFLCEFERKNPTLKTSRSSPQLANQDFFGHHGEAFRKLAPHVQTHILPKEPVGSSAETTPTTTPQGSPYIIRKIREINPEDSSSKKWFYGGKFEHKPLFTVSEEKQPDGGRSSRPVKSAGARPSSSNKKYNVSNFDINAVSPTSW